MYVVRTIEDILQEDQIYGALLLGVKIFAARHQFVYKLQCFKTTECILHVVLTCDTHRVVMICEVLLPGVMICGDIHHEIKKTPT